MELDYAGEVEAGHRVSRHKIWPERCGNESLRQKSGLLGYLDLLLVGLDFD